MAPMMMNKPKNTSATTVMVRHPAMTIAFCVVNASDVELIMFKSGAMGPLSALRTSVLIC